jgi:hypothetical protein
MAEQTTQPQFTRDQLDLTQIARPVLHEKSTTTALRFEDDAWDLTRFDRSTNGRVTLYFSDIPDRHVETVKTLIAALLLQDPLLPDLRIRTLLGWLGHLRIFTKLFPETALADLTAGDLHRWADGRARKHGEQWVRNHLMPVSMLFHHADRLPDGLAVDPALVIADEDRQATSESLPDRPGTPTRPNRENKTRRIPEDVLKPLVAWALLWVEHFASDIVSAQSEFEHLLNRRAQAERLAGGPWVSITHRLEEYATDRRARGRGIPSMDGERPAKSFIARQLGVTTGTLKGKPTDRLVALAAELGYEDGTLLDTVPTIWLDNAPWVASFDYRSVPKQTRLLQTACYIVVAYLSGMRDSEIKDMRVGCSRTWRDDSGNEVRHSVRSRVFKNSVDIGGDEAEWVVGAPAATAVEVLELLRSDGDPYLFRPAPGALGYSVGTTASRTPQLTLKDIEEFVRWIAEQPDSGSDSPGSFPADRPLPHVTTRQFRRTLAWHIAREPGGVIAGAIQYKQLSVAIHEGYAGTSRSGFAAEVEAEQALARGEWLVDLTTGHEHPAQGSAADRELERRLVAFRTVLDANAPTVVTDPARLRLIMKQDDPNIFQGDFVTCVFDVERARCTQDPTGPEMRNCEPFDCTNVALTAENRSRWEGQVADLEDAVAVAPPYVRSRLTTRISEINELLDTRDR